MASKALPFSKSRTRLFLSRSHLINASLGVGALAPTFKDKQDRALAPEAILLFQSRPFMRGPMASRHCSRLRQMFAHPACPAGRDCVRRVCRQASWQRQPKAQYRPILLHICRRPKSGRAFPHASNRACFGNNRCLTSSIKQAAYVVLDSGGQPALSSVVGELYAGAK